MMRAMRRVLIVLLACMVALVLGGTGMALAGTETVTNNDDVGPGSLRQAINNAAEGETIVVPAGIGTIALDSEELSVSHSLTIDGAGLASTVISGSGVLPVIAIKGSITVSISGVTITDGLAREPGGIVEGGGMTVAGATVTLANSAVSDNTADASDSGTKPGGIAEGGGIAVLMGAHLTLIDTTVSGNRALANASGTASGGIAEGGGIFTRESSLAVFGGGIRENLVESSGASGSVAAGGGLDYRGSASTTATLEGLEVAGNVVVGDATSATGSGGDLEGGGIDLFEGSGSATLSDLAIADNSESATGGSNGSGGFGEGGGIFDGGPPTTLTDSTVTANSVTSNGQGSAEAGAGRGGGIAVSSALMSILNSTIAANAVAASGSAAGPVIGGNLSVEPPGVQVKNSIVTAGVAPLGSENCSVSTAMVSDGHNIDSLDQCDFHAAGDHVNTNPELGSLQNNGGPVQTMALLSASPAIDAGEDLGCPARDARGVNRPQGAACDIGAYELAPATAVTAAASGVSSTGATLSGSASNPDALGGSVAFEFGKTTAYGSTTASQTVAAGATAASFGAVLTGLQPGTTYHFRELVTNAAGTAFGSDQTFTTPSIASGPVVSPSLKLVGRVASALGGKGIRFSLACAAGLPCPVSAVASTTETLRGSKVASLAKRRRRTVIVGNLTAKILAGRTEVLILKLNATGRRLQQRFGRLPVTLTITLTLPDGAHLSIERAHLTLALPRKRHRQRR
jgi:hypothetical protein